MKQEIKAAHEQYANDPKGLKEAILRIKRKFYGNKVRKIGEAKVQKSQVLEECFRRAEVDETFRKSLEEIMEKALTSGGPAYGQGIAMDSMSGGQCFQS